MSSDTITSLGQVGIHLCSKECSLFIDPYLTDSVAKTYGVEFSRMVPPPFSPTEAPPVDHILLTHAHMDHTDPDTLLPLIGKYPEVSLTGSYEVAELLQKVGVNTTRPLPLQWEDLSDRVKFRSVPAAHTSFETNSLGEWRYCGFLIKVEGFTIYHAGDTIPHPAIFESLKGERIDLALLPVNERNYYRDAKDIIGNMSLRDAFQMAEDLGVGTLIPTHWDLFASNSVHRREIELMYELEHPSFRLKILEIGESLDLISL